MTDIKTQDVPEKNPIASGSAFIGLMSGRSNEARLRWNGVQLVVLMNIPTLFWMGYKLSAATYTSQIYFTFAFGCIIAALLNWQWYVILHRDSGFFELWNESLVSLEEENGIEGEVKIFTSPKYRRLSKSRNSIQRTLERFAAMLIFVWAIAFIALVSWSFAKL